MTTKNFSIIVTTISLTIVFVGSFVFFDSNPFRVGEITIAKPDGTSVILKVGNSNEISELIRKGLENEETSGPLANSLLSIIEGLPSKSPLAEKLMGLAEKRHPPFYFESVVVKLKHAKNVPKGLVSVCENSRFLSKNIVIYVLNDEGDLIEQYSRYADTKQGIPCHNGSEMLRVNETDIDGFQDYTVKAKRAL